jgi:hemoglobin-like flavoprotein
MNMTTRQIELVRESFRLVKPISDAAGRLFYQRLIRLDPSLEPMFHGKLEEQGRKLMQMIGALVGMLDHIDQVTMVLADLGRKHAAYGVRDSHYALGGAALIWTLEQGLGDAFTTEVRSAWVALYYAVVRAMRESTRAAVAA